MKLNTKIECLRHTKCNIACLYLYCDLKILHYIGIEIVSIPILIKY